MRRSKASRQEQILAELNRSPSLRVAELARRLVVSTETIRRDLDAMTEQGLLNRTYGGAVRPLGTEPSVTERHALHVPERERIAKVAVPLLKTARILMIGSGATTVHVARRIAVEMKNIAVITHSFGVATVLSLNPTIKVLMMPGDYHPGEGATVGAHAVSFLNDFHADCAIIGASGLAPDGPRRRSSNAAPSIRRWSPAPRAAWSSPTIRSTTASSPPATPLAQRRDPRHRPPSRRRLERRPRAERGQRRAGVRVFSRQSSLGSAGGR